MNFSAEKLNILLCWRTVIINGCPATGAWVTASLPAVPAAQPYIVAVAY